MNTMTLVKSILLAAGVAVAVTPTMSMAKGKGARLSFEELDADKSGEVTQAEMQAAAEAKFAKADVDGDGFLTKDEMGQDASKRATKRINKMFDRRDANDDGKLSVEELRPDAERIAKRFDKVDADNSGGISKAEFDAMKKHRKGRGKGKTE